MAETLTDPMTGFDPTRPAQDLLYRGGDRPNLLNPSEQNYEFDPQREITPLAGRFFADVEANPNLSREAKLRVQAGYLTGIEEVREQRSKIENERMRSIMDRQTIEMREQSLAEARRRQEDATRSAERQKTIAEQAKGIIGSNLSPDEQRRQLGALQIEHLAEAATDPTVRSIFDTAAGVLPPPPEPLYSTKDMRDLAEAGVPYDVILNGNPAEIGEFRRDLEIKRKEESDDLSERKDAAKAYRTRILELTEKAPAFMSEDDAVMAGVDMENDPNARSYLTTQSQQDGKQLIWMLYGKAGLDKYETLSDAERRDAIMAAQLDGARQALLRSATVEAIDEEDVSVDSLLFGTKKR
jgi:hypothetical protein